MQSSRTHVQRRQSGEAVADSEILARPMRLTKTARRVESSAYDWEPPSEFDGYRLKSCIGRGAMGRVYLAQDTILDRPIAIKFIDAFKPDSEQQERFLLEARAVARLQHPNVVAIYRVGDVQGHPYIASEFVRGDRLDYLPLPVSGERALRIGLGWRAVWPRHIDAGYFTATSSPPTSFSVREPRSSFWTLDWPS